MSGETRHVGPNELRRSYTTGRIDLSKESRSSSLRQQQIRENAGNKRRSTAMPSNRGKPTMEIYRPPNVRSDVFQNGLVTANPKLNVHAKEFTMKQGELTTSRSTVNVPAVLNNHQHKVPNALQLSKSSGNGLHQLHQSKSSGNVLHHLQQPLIAGPQQVVLPPRVHFQLGPTPIPNQNESVAIRHPPPPDFVPKSPLKSYSVTEMKSALHHETVKVPETVVHSYYGATALPSGLKRSKSLGAADMARQAAAASMAFASESPPDLGKFSPEIQEFINQAARDPNILPSRAIMTLVQEIMTRVSTSVTYALPGAKFCITIIEKEKKETFLESLLNTCRLWYQERNHFLRLGGGTSTRFCAFMQFLNEMYCELKRRQLQLKTQYDGVPPDLVLLTLLYECCVECLKPPITHGQTDALFFVLTSIGRDLEQEIPGKLTFLLGSIRDAFLKVSASTAVKKTLLQLVELRAARWQLSAAAVMYYTTQ